jgi:ElaB/YqjD/DUF883 family membrane-anchored ribosome-binding protein
MAGASRIPQETKEKAEELKDQAKDSAGNISQRAQDMASNVTQRAQDLAAQARERAGEVMAGVGSKAHDLADTIRERAPQEGPIGRAANAVADQIEAGGAYISERGLNEMFSDVSTVVRNHPVPSIFVLLGVGFLMGRATGGR